MKKAALVFPHQLFKSNSENFIDHDIFLIEEHLFFNQYNFHKQKLVFHRASMKSHELFLKENTPNAINYIEAISEFNDVRKLITHLISSNYEQITYIDPTDYLLSKRIKSFSSIIKLIELPTSLFLNSSKENELFFQSKKRMFQTEFYINQRKKFKVLVTENNLPEGGQWSFDADNRKKYPTKKIPPITIFPVKGICQKEAENYVNKHFSTNVGFINEDFSYPIDYSTAYTWLNNFLKERFEDFGIYEDAIVKNHTILNHSLLSPLINVGLLTVDYVIDTTIEFHNKNAVSLNSTEGFIRQIIGWREFIRAVYELKGNKERTTNFWNFSRKIPKSFYDGTTGIEPVDTVIKKTLQTGYCHHIERLMILGNFMLICEFDPDEVYKWFMELFIDAYDWVMVPNVYGMSQFADGGIMSTKPYFSGSNYIMKMSDFGKGDWQETWDCLFWRFMHVHRDFFKKNPRLNMLISSFDKMDDNKRKMLLSNAEEFLNQLG